MHKYFSKIEEKSEVDLNLVDVETAKHQLKSMKLGYISSSFILRGMEEDFEKWHKENIEDSEYTEEDLKEAEKLALKQVEDPEFYHGEVMKNTPERVAQCFQSLLMLKNKKDDIAAKSDELSIVARNIKWLRKLIKDLKEKEVVAPKGTIQAPKK